MPSYPPLGDVATALAVRVRGRFGGRSAIKRQKNPISRFAQQSNVYRWRYPKTFSRSRANPFPRRARFR
ncbi:MAG TPA: hypothetical protein VFA26_01135 [Gemmataceae bacterium]|nr:hypothetical protein [Gemmataceae bacterium]